MVFDAVRPYSQTDGVLHCGFAPMYVVMQAEGWVGADTKFAIQVLLLSMRLGYSSVLKQGDVETILASLTVGRYLPSSCFKHLLLCWQCACRHL